MFVPRFSHCLDPWSFQNKHKMSLEHKYPEIVSVLSLPVFCCSVLIQHLQHTVSPLQHSHWWGCGFWGARFLWTRSVKENQPPFPSSLCSFHYVTSVCPLPHHNQSGAPRQITIIVLQHSAALQRSPGRGRGCYMESLSKANARCHSPSRSAVCFKYAVVLWQSFPRHTE